MPSTQPDPLFSVADIGIFPCPRCGKPMRLSCIETTKPGFDVRTNARNAKTP
jgi:ssDNA-binding Zn-finger/Zn-ribbon topoisomerase 1